MRISDWDTCSLGWGFQTSVSENPQTPDVAALQRWATDETHVGTLWRRIDPAIESDEAVRVAAWTSLTALLSTRSVADIDAATAERWGWVNRVLPSDEIGPFVDRLAGRIVFIVDDNLIGNRPQAKVLLAFLAEYQARHCYRFSFGTEASLNLARDAELVRLMVAAGFGWVFIGIETTDEASLKETKKTQNVGGDILADVRRMYTSGIDVLAGFIIGFDNDTLATFDQQPLGMQTPEHVVGSERCDELLRRGLIEPHGLGIFSIDNAQNPTMFLVT